MAAQTSAQTNAFSLHSFHEFFKKWIAEQKHFLNQLISATKSPTTSIRDKYSLVSRVIVHYEEYYRVKSHWAKKDVLAMLSPPWRTELEAPFQWIGGWRPSMAFHLLYSKSGLQLEAWLVQASQASSSSTGTSTTPPDDLSNLGSHQLGLVNQLQANTVEEERKITEKMAKHQETIADMEMVQLTHEATMLMGDGEGLDEEDRGEIESTLEVKEDGLKKILESADDLRLRTLKGVIQILSPNQALHFLIAAAELHLRLHEWGKKHNDNKLNYLIT